MTSPSLPVRFSSPLPGISVTSIESRSPPTLVTAAPVATPTSSCSSASPNSYLGTPRYCGKSSESIEISDTRLFRKFANHAPQRVVSNGKLLSGQTVRIERLRQQEVPRDREFL